SLIGRLCRICGLYPSSRHSAASSNPAAETTKRRYHNSRLHPLQPPVLRAPQIASVQGKWLWQGGTDAWQLAIGFSVSSLLNSSANAACSFPLSCTGCATIISQLSSSVLRFSSATNPRAFKASFTSGFSPCCRSHPEPIDGVLAISTQSTIECRPLISLS